MDKARHLANFKQALYELFGIGHDQGLDTTEFLPFSPSVGKRALRSTVAGTGSTRSVELVPQRTAPRESTRSLCRSSECSTANNG